MRTFAENQLRSPQRVQFREEENKGDWVDEDHNAETVEFDPDRTIPLCQDSFLCSVEVRTSKPVRKLVSADKRVWMDWIVQNRKLNMYCADSFPCAVSVNGIKTGGMMRLDKPDMKASTTQPISIAGCHIPSRETCATDAGPLAELAKLSGV